MSTAKFTESSLEDAIIEQLVDLGYEYAIDTDQWDDNAPFGCFYQ